MLHPQPVGLALALHQQMRVLAVGIARLVGRQIGGAHAVGAARPAVAAVIGLPHATAGDPKPHHLRIARIDADGMNTGQVRPAAEPLSAAGMIPERTHELPAIAAVARTEETAGDGAAPQKPGLVRPSGLERPDADDGPWHRLTPAVGINEIIGLGRESRCRAFLPAPVCLGAMQLHPEMTMVKGGKSRAGARVVKRNRYILGKEIDLADAPAAAPPRDGEESLPCRDQN